MIVLSLLSLAALAAAGPVTDNFKDQFCTDPRTMKKHQAYTEWADAYSCTRHRCQPGGRNLAIYTVGCKRVEAPESAIECEEVVEDTNMQFPYCCTRLRCLVVVRGEVWTRVLGQPWETLPAAPWSHMYKMKKPPPGESGFLPKPPGEGPVYELQTETDDKVLRASSKKSSTESPDCNDSPPRTNPGPDIVIALSTGTDGKEHKKGNDNESGSIYKKKRGRKTSSTQNYYDDEQVEPRNEEPEDSQASEKPIEPLGSDERYYANSFGITQKVPIKVEGFRLADEKPPSKSQHHQQVSWTEIPQSQWNAHVEHEAGSDPEAARLEDSLQTKGLSIQKEPVSNYHQPDFPETEKKEVEKPANLQALVDAIGTRMRDIESVVQRMSEKVQQSKPGTLPAEEFGSNEKISRVPVETESHKHREHEPKEHKEAKMKKPNPDGDHYKRFRNHGTKYVHTTTDSTTEQPLFIEDSNLNGYFSDASNTMVRRASQPKEPAATYMAPVENRRKTPAHISVLSDASDEAEKKHKKHAHKKRRTKGNHHKKHHGKDDKRKRFNRLNSVELDKNVVASVEDSSNTGSK